MVELNQRTALLRHLNIRKEVSGESKRTAIDVEFTLIEPNNFLNVFAPGLRDALYDKPDQVDLAQDADHAPVKRFVPITRIDWGLEMAGVKITVHRGVSGKNDIVIEGAEVNKFRIEPNEGGQVAVMFRVQGHPQPGDIDRISDIIGDFVSLSVEPPR